MNKNENDTMSGRLTMGGVGAGGRPEWTGTMSGRTTADGEEGVVLAGRYRVVRRLGEGGMGSVWLAEDMKLDGKLFAIKMLPAVLAGKKGAYRQVKAEAVVAMKLSHPNIATVRAFEEDEGGQPFLVMDYIEGEGLDDILAERGPLGEEETRRVLGPVAAALDYAHSQGVVHRDVKPGNVMVSKDGTPFVLDFGIAREIQETLTRVTGKLSSGTLLYMSPEQLNGRAPKAAQDVYSFAAMAYECLAGRPPFSRGQIEWQIVKEAPEELPESVGEGLRAGVMAGLAKEAEGRPGSCMGVLGEGGASRPGEPGKGAAARPQQRLGGDASPHPGADGGREWEQRLEDEQKAKREAEQRYQRMEALRDAAAREAERERTLREEAEQKRAETETKWRRQQAEESVRRAEAEAARGRAAGWNVFLVMAMVVAGFAAFAWWQGQANDLRKPVGGAQVAAQAAGKMAGETTVGRPRIAGESPAPPEERAGDVFSLDLGGGVTLEMVHCPGVAGDFWMGKTEVTQEQWQRVMGKNPSEFAGKPKNPVENVSWNDCQEFVKKVNALPAARASGLTFRLPTEEEWETACRAGAPKPADYCKLADGTQITEATLSKVARFDKEWDDGPVAVGSFLPNAWGLYDMHGNVWEWTQTADGGHRVDRGGGFSSTAGRCSAGVRVRVDPDRSPRDLGLRLAASGRAATR